MPDIREQLQTSLGAAYSLQRELGGGGMSHVFLATDTTLDRDVVVKVLPFDASTALSVERFKREIALAAKLQHPHIVPLLSAGATAEGLPYYTMPFVEGESLRERLARDGELPVSEAVGILREVARALAYAHERGVVHRDIKPDNVMLSGGSAMVTDFGVAKAVSAAASGEHSASLHAATLTQLGVSLGTPAYMAPEQAAGDPNVDRRADLYGFGCMAYEMLTGQPPFTGRTVQALLAAHVNEAPESIERRRPSVPPILASLVMQCLEKHAADRPANATDVLRMLDSVALTPTGVPTTLATMAARSRAPAVSSARLQRRTIALGVLAVAGIAAVVWGARGRVVLPPRPPVRFSIARLPDEGPSLAEPDPAVSADGRYIVYRAAIGSGSRLDMRAIDEFESRPIPGTENATHPFFSPDGKWLAFFADGKLQKMPVDGGPATIIVEMPASSGASWAANGDIVVGGATGARGAGLLRVPSGGGTPVPLTRPDSATGESHVAPIVLADGKTILFESESGTGGLSANVVAVGSLETSAFTRLNISAVRPLGIVDGGLVFSRSDGALMGVPFDAGKKRVTGDPKGLGPRVADFALAAALSASGTLVYLEGNTTSRVAWVSANGGVTVVLETPQVYEFPRLSPDGKRLAIAIHGALSTDVWLCDLATGTLSRFTTLGSINDRPEWSPDGRRLLFRSTRDKGSAMWWQASDGSGSPERLTGGSSVWEGVISPDGKTLLYRETIPGRSGYQIMYKLIAGDGTPRLFTSAPGNLQMPRFSPDGAWIVYQSDESGKFEIYVRPFPSGTSRHQISAGGGTEPLWSADGKRIYYRKGPQLITATIVGVAEPSVSARTSVLLDTTAQSQSRTHPKYDVARDGRVIMPRMVGDGTKLGVVLNWSEELRAVTMRK